MIDFTENNGVLRLPKTRISEAESVFLEAFSDYPLFNSFFADPKIRKSNTQHFFRFVLRYGVNYGLVLATEGMEGVVILLPPKNIKMTTRKMLLSGVNKYLRSVGLKNALEIDKICDSFFEAQQRLVPSPHWYLMFIGVKPSLQGKGFGRKLCDSVFSLMDSERLPLYLETQDEKDVGIYEKLGFKMAEASNINGMQNFCFVREPA